MRSTGGTHLTTAELVELVVGRGSKGRTAAEVAQDLLGVVAGGSVARLGKSSVGELVQVAGLSVERAAAVLAAFELGRRATLEKVEAEALRGPRDVWRLAAPRIEHLSVEVFAVCLLDAQHRLTRWVEVTRGILNSSLVHPREVFREAIAERAASLVLLHNHPSGDPNPSADDRAITTQLVSAGRLLDIPVQDHVVIGAGRYISFAEAGLM